MSSPFDPAPPARDDGRSPWLAHAPLPGAEPSLTQSTATPRERVMEALAHALGYADWKENPISNRKQQLGVLADAAIHALLEAPPDDDRADNGEYLPSRRPLTARERDVVARVIGSIVRPWTRAGRAEKASAETRRQLERHLDLRGPNDLRVLNAVREAIDPRSEGERDGFSS